MLEMFKDEIPKLAELVVEIEDMISDPDKSLEDIREAILEHITVQSNMTDDDYESMGEASSTAYGAIDVLIDQLEENELNAKRLLEYLASYHSYPGFNRVIMSFDKYIPRGQRNRLLKEGKRIFIKKLTKHWQKPA